MITSSLAQTFEDAIVRDPDDRAAYLVYADWLVDRGDSRGELIIVQDELERVPATELERHNALRARELQILNQHLSAWMGGEVRGPRIKLYWQCGFLDHLALDYREADLGGLARLFRSPLCRLVRRVDLRTNVREGLAALRAADLRRLETLNLGSYRWASWSTRGIADAFPNLQHLDCDADSIDLADLRFAVLRSFGVAANGLTLENIDAIASAELPMLVSLQIWGGYMREPEQPTEDDYDDANPAPWFPAARLRTLLDAEGLPELRSLQFDSCSFGDQLVDAVAESQLVRRLDNLTLDDDEFSAAAYQRLLEHAESFRHLRTLRLRDCAAASAVKTRFVDALGSIVVWL